MRRVVLAPIWAACVVFAGCSGLRDRGLTRVGAEHPPQIAAIVQAPVRGAARWSAPPKAANAIVAERKKLPSDPATAGSPLQNSAPQVSAPQDASPQEIASQETASQPSAAVSVQQVPAATNEVVSDVQPAKVAQIQVSAQRPERGEPDPTETDETPASAREASGVEEVRSDVADVLSDDAELVGPLVPIKRPAAAQLSERRSTETHAAQPRKDRSPRKTAPAKRSKKPVEMKAGKNRPSIQPLPRIESTLEKASSGLSPLPQEPIPIYPETGSADQPLP